MNLESPEIVSLFNLIIDMILSPLNYTQREKLDTIQMLKSLKIRSYSITSGRV